MSVWVWVAVTAVSGLAAVVRFLVDWLVSARARSAFPLGILVVNGSGACALGLLAGLAVSGDLLLIAGTATLGSYTTFSTWMLETEELAEDGRVGLAAVNVLVSLAIGLGAVALGRALGAAL
jgi:fluoride exporter